MSPNQWLGGVYLLWISLPPVLQMALVVLVAQ